MERVGMSMGLLAVCVEVSTDGLAPALVEDPFIVVVL